MDSEKMFIETVQSMKDGINKMDNFNHKMLRAIQIIVIAFISGAVVCFGILYLSDYTTTNMQQQQQVISHESTNQQQMGGK